MTREISDKAKAILQLISEGHTYDQIVQHYPDLTYKNIFQAAEEALSLLNSKNYSSLAADQTEVRKRYPRHMKPWEDGEEAEMRKQFGLGKNVRDIAKQLQRKPSAIRSRLVWLGLLKPPEYPPSR